MASDPLRFAFPSLASRWDELTPKFAELEARYIAEAENTRMTNAQAIEILELMGLSSVLPALESEEIIGSDPDDETLMLDMSHADWESILSGEATEVLDLMKATVSTLKGEYNLSQKANQH